MTDIPHFAFPLTLDPRGHPINVNQDSLDHVRDQLHAALLTRIGQGTPLRPSWGTDDLALRQQPLDTEALVAQLTDLVPSAEVHVDQLPDLLDEALLRLNVTVQAGE